MECRIEDRVIIRIWTSEYNLGDGVGHISIQTPNNYMSLWPKGHPSKGLMQYFEVRAYDLLQEFKHDVTLEERDPEFVVCLYSIEFEKIEDKFREFKKKLQGWTLLGSNRLLNSGSAESCATLALSLLRAGGLLLEDSCFSSSVTPDKMAEVVIAAKKQELLEHPETTNFKFDSETDLEHMFNYRKSTCILV